MTTTTLGATRPLALRHDSRPAVQGPPVQRAQLTQWVALVGSLCAATLLGYVVVALPNRLMLSEYVHVPGGLVPFVGGLLALAVAAFAAARLAPPAAPAAAGVLRVAGAAAVVAAAFPTDATRLAVPSLAGQIHRYAALVVFLGLPLAGWLLVHRRPGAWSAVARVLTGTATVAVVATLLLHPTSPVAAVVGHTGWEGVAQRLMAVSDVVLVAVMALLGRDRSS